MGVALDPDPAVWDAGGLVREGDVENLLDTVGDEGVVTIDAVGDEGGVIADAAALRVYHGCTGPEKVVVKVEPPPGATN